MTDNDKTPTPKVPHKTPRESHDMDHDQMGEHEGATEEEVTDIPAPAGSAFKDEPKQG